MRKLAGWLIAIGGLVAAAYVGVVIFAVGGIERFVDGLNQNPANGSKIAWGIVQFWAADAAAVVVAGACIAIGWYVGTGTVPLWISRRQQRKRYRQRQERRLKGGVSSRW